jgi:hypothetical protein
MRRTASEVPTTPIEIAKSRSTVDESPCDPDEKPELDEDEDAVPDVVPVLLLVCDVEEIVDEVSEESRTSKLNHIKSIFFRFLKDDLHEHINNSIIATGWDGYMNRMFLIRSTGPLSNYP